MQFLFKTHYNQDIDHLVDRGERIRVGAVIILAFMAPVFFGSYYLSELSFLLVYALAGLGLMVLTGFSGQLSFGHAAFLGIGAYVHSILLGFGVPFFISLIVAGVFTGLVGAVVGRAASGMHGFYLAIATFAFAIITEAVIGAGGALTGGHMGLSVPPLVIFGYELSATWQRYYIILAIFLFFVWAVANLMRAPTGRAMIAVRDSETSARSLGVNIHRTKILAFFISALITGVAGGLMAHMLQSITPETFGVVEALKLVLMVVVGGLGSITGAILGAVFISFIPNFIGLLRDILPASMADQAGLEQLLFGGIIAAFIIFEPEGLYGRWRKFRLFLETFPYYKKATFVRQKSYLKTDRFE